MIQWTIIIDENLDPLSVYFPKTNIRKRHNNSLLYIFVDFVTINLWFQYLCNFSLLHSSVYSFVISSTRRLRSCFPLSLANISAKCLTLRNSRSVCNTGTRAGSVRPRVDVCWISREPLKIQPSFFGCLLAHMSSSWRHWLFDDMSLRWRHVWRQTCHGVT